MQIPLINEHLFCKYFVRLSVGNATKGLATYGCFHPCCLDKVRFNLIVLVYLVYPNNEESPQPIKKAVNHVEVWYTLVG